MNTIIEKTLRNGYTIKLYQKVAAYYVTVYNPDGKAIDGRNTWYYDNALHHMTIMENKYSK